MRKPCETIFHPMTTSICCCRFSPLMVWTRNDQKTNPASGQGGAWTPYGWFATSTRWPLDHAALLPVGLGTLRSDDGDGGEERQKSNRFSNQNNTFAPSLHGYDVKMPNFTLYRGRTQSTTKFPLYLNLDMVLRNSTLEGSTCIWQS